jgi:hypothetical protein
LGDKEDKMWLRVIEANKSENGMLLKDHMDELSREHMAILARDERESKVT